MTTQCGLEEDETIYASERVNCLELFMEVERVEEHCVARVNSAVYEEAEVN